MLKSQFFKCRVGFSLLHIAKNPNIYKNVNYRNLTSIRLNSTGSKQKITPLGWLLLGIPATTFGLGVWQVKRLSWKQNLIKELERKVNAPPIDLPDNLADINKLEYRAIKVRGKFLHDKEIIMGPRSFINHGDGTSNSGLFSQDSKGVGYHVITPLKIEGREETILVNRGWVSRKHQDPSTRKAGQINDTIDIVGVVRINEARPQFSPESKSDCFLYRDLSKMCSITGAEPIFLDARSETTIPGGPIGGQTRITLRNDHLSYLVTWFCLSAATSLMWYRTILKGIRV